MKNENSLIMFVVAGLVCYFIFLMFIEDCKAEYQWHKEEMNAINSKDSTINYFRIELNKRAFITKEQVENGCWVKSNRKKGCVYP